MNCKACGSQIPDGMRFCVNCGAPAPRAELPDPPANAPRPQGVGAVPPVGAPAQDRQTPRQTAYGQGGAQQSFPPYGAAETYQAYGTPVDPPNPYPPYGPQETHPPYGAPVDPQNPYPPYGQPVDPPVPAGPVYVPADGSSGGRKREEHGSGNALKIVLIVLAILALGVAIFFAVLFFMERSRGETENAGAQNSVNIPAALTGEGATEPTRFTEPAATTAEPTTEKPATEPSRTLPPPPVFAKYTPGAYYIPTQGGIRLRSTHSLSGKVYVFLLKGTTVNVTEIWEDPTASDPVVRWWGKTVYRGVTGWFSLYYAVNTDGGSYTYEDDSYVIGAWNTLYGASWYTEKTAQYIRFSFQDGQPALETAGFSGVMNGHITGNLEGVFTMPVYAGGRNVTVKLDLSEAGSGRIAVALPDGVWVEYMR